MVFKIRKYLKLVIENENLKIVIANIRDYYKFLENLVNYFTCFLCINKNHILLIYFN